MTETQGVKVDIFVGRTPGQLVDVGDTDAVRTDSKRIKARTEGVVSLPLDQVADKQTVSTIKALGDEVDHADAGWGISEIEIGLTRSAEGRVLWIATAGVEASVTIELSRR